MPEEVKREVQEIFSAATPRAAQRLVELMEDPDSRIALAAASTLLDRVLGKAVTPVDQKVTTTTIQQAHLAALMEIHQRRKERIGEDAHASTATSGVIDVTPVQSGSENQQERS